MSLFLRKEARADGTLTLFFKTNLIIMAPGSFQLRQQSKLWFCGGSCVLIRIKPRLIPSTYSVKSKKQELKASARCFLERSDF